MVWGVPIGRYTYFLIAFTKSGHELEKQQKHKYAGYSPHGVHDGSHNICT